MSDTKQVILRPVSIILTSLMVVVAATFLGLLCRVTWEGFSWGWGLFGL